ncbi:MAG: insulinase family protein [Candidatus Eremiobacteraeota bacterium]|nr:insulinase family protein [Candidatus Eremiobacteraeota bacterium]
MLRAVTVAGLACLGVCLQAAAPRPPSASFPPVSVERLSNGVAIVSQPAAHSQLIGAQVFLQTGLMQQPPDKAGIAAIAASLVMRTPVEGGQTLDQIATRLGASVSYTLDPTATRFYIEARPDDFPRLLHDLRDALRHPSLAAFAQQQAKTSSDTADLSKSPLEAAYAMVRRVRYAGTAFALPDSGSALSLANISSADVQQYVLAAQHAGGTVVALAGSITSDALDATKREFSDFSMAAASTVPPVHNEQRTRQIVAHRDVASPWIAVAYPAPNQYSADFASMLVIEALLGQGGDVHALAFGSNSATPTDFLGAFYQYEADPGSLIVFLDGSSSNVDQAVRDLKTGVTRLRDHTLPAGLVDEAKHLALGNYYLSTGNLNQLSWLLGRAYLSPEGVQFENTLPQRIARVSAAQIRRIAQRYLAQETVAIVLPTTDSH